MDTIYTILHETNSHSYIQILKDWASIIAAIIASGTAIWGLNTWRIQHKLKTRYELARRVLLSIYKVKDAVLAFRNIWMDKNEMISAIKNENININDTKLESKEISKIAYIHRWNNIADTMSKLRADYIESEILLDIKLIESFKAFYNYINDLHYQFEIFIKYQDNLHREEKIAMKTAIYNTHTEKYPNENTIIFENIIETMEKHLKKYIKL